jgi:hypothetical protein
MTIGSNSTVPSGVTAAGGCPLEAGGFEAFPLEQAAVISRHTAMITTKAALCLPFFLIFFLLNYFKSFKALALNFSNFRNTLFRQTKCFNLPE